MSQINLNSININAVDKIHKKGTLIFFCGKMCAGKSTTAQEIARSTNAVLLSEDSWLAELYPGAINDLDDYLKYSARLKGLLKKHVQDMLRSGVPVVMDFPANTRQQRSWFKQIFLDESFAHKLIYLEAENTLCLQRLSGRRETHPERRQFDNEATFHQVTSYFQPPLAEEGFNVSVIPQE